MNADEVRAAVANFQAMLESYGETLGTLRATRAQLDAYRERLERGDDLRSTVLWHLREQVVRVDEAVAQTE